jgi:hypothetical protein
MTDSQYASQLAAGVRKVSKRIESKDLIPGSFVCWAADDSPVCTMAHAFAAAGFKKAANGAVGQLVAILDEPSYEAQAAMYKVMACSDRYSKMVSYKRAYKTVSKKFGTSVMWETKRPASEEAIDAARKRLVNSLDKLAHELDKPVPRTSAKTKG